MKADESKGAETSTPEETEVIEKPGNASIEEFGSHPSSPDEGFDSDQKSAEESATDNDVIAPDGEGSEKKQAVPQNGPTAKNNNSFAKKNKKAIIGCSIIAVAAIGVALVNCLVVPYLTYLDAKSKFDSKEYAAAAESYAGIAGFLDSDELKSTAEKAAHYTLGVKALAKKDYGTAIDHFTAADNFEDANEQLEEAKTLKTYSDAEDAMKNGSYELAGVSYASIIDYKDSREKAAKCADNLMKSADYSKAKKLYDKLGSDYAEQANKAKTAIDNQESMQSAEEKISDGDFTGALELYNKVPDDFSLNGKKAGDRKQQLNKAIEASNAAGTFSATNANVKVTQTHRSTGNWYCWTSDDTSGAKVTVKATMADDGTVTLDGTVTYWRYMNYSSISSALKYRTVTEEFTCSANPGTIQLDSETSLSYDGSWHLRFKRVDESQDVYFRYTYEASFDYSK